MQFLAEQSLHEVPIPSRSGQLEGMNTDEHTRMPGPAAMKKRREEKTSVPPNLGKALRNWGIGAGCVASLLLLFAIFHTRPAPEQRVAFQAESPALQESAAPTLKMATTQRASSAPVPQPGIAAMYDTIAVQSKSASPSAAEGPMIARSVSLTILVKEIAGSRSLLDTILARYRGYAAELNINTPENAARSFGASLRIPASALSPALEDLRKLGRVQIESQSGEEVTQQHTDLAARLRNARETEQRLIAILQQRTGKVSDVLAVEEQISNTRGEIERMEAELQTLEHRVDFATVQLQLTEDYKAQLNPPSATVGTRLHNALVAGLGNAGASLLGMLLFLEEYGPVLLVWFAILGMPAWLVWRRYRRADNRITAS